MLKEPRCAPGCSVKSPDIRRITGSDRRRRPVLNDSCSGLRLAPTAASAASPPASTATAKTTCGTPPADTSPRQDSSAAGIATANATFDARRHDVWGESTTTVAADSTHFAAYDRNIFTQWHSCYGGRES